MMQLKHDIVIGIIATMLAMSAGHLHADELGTQANRLPVKITQLQRMPVLEQRVFTGTTRAAHRSVMRSQIGGRVVQLPVKLGETVRQGDLLLELYNPEAAPAATVAQRQWESARSRHNQRQRDFDRVAVLLKKGTASDHEFEQARTALDTAKDDMLAAKSEHRRAQLLDAERHIRAPFNGVVTAIETDVGEVVAPGQALLRVADPAQVELELVINHQIAATLQPGTAINVTLPLESGTLHQGKVQEVSPFRERGSLPTVVLSFPQQQVKAGVAASAHFQRTLEPSFTVPMSALVSNGEGAIIYRIDTDNRAWQIPVATGLIQPNGIAISGSLEEGDRVVVAGSQRLFDGAAIGVQP